MKDFDLYFDSNKKMWNARTPIHVASDFYDNEAFLEGKSSLKQIEINGLGNIKDKSVLHLQCHFGQDSISMRRLGADVTAIDLSDIAIDQGKKMAADLNLDVRFECCNVYDVAKVIDDKFDIVFTSYGTICWLPDLDVWATIIAEKLKAGGRFYMVDFHPVLEMFDWETKKLMYNYFKTNSPYSEESDGTYADESAAIKLKEYFWIHPMDSIITSLMKSGLTMTKFKEHDYSPYNCFPNLIERSEGEFVFDVPVNMLHLYEIEFIK